MNGVLAAGGPAVFWVFSAVTCIHSTVSDRRQWRVPAEKRIAQLRDERPAGRPLGTRTHQARGSLGGCR